MEYSVELEFQVYTDSLPYITKGGCLMTSRWFSLLLAMMANTHRCTVYCNRYYNRTVHQLLPLFVCSARQLWRLYWMIIFNVRNNDFLNVYYFFQQNTQRLCGFDNIYIVCLTRGKAWKLKSERAYIRNILNWRRSAILKGEFEEAAAYFLFLVLNHLFCTSTDILPVLLNKLWAV